MNELDVPSVVLTVGDYKRLQAIARALEEQLHPLAAILSAKLSRAEVRDADEVPEGIVSLDRFVTYRNELSGEVTRRLLIHPDDRMWPPAEISVDTPVGITLIGSSAGHRMPMVGVDTPAPPWLRVVEVEAAASGGIARRPAFVGGFPRIA